MKISELITRLLELKEQEGDVPIVIKQGRSWLIGSDDIINVNKEVRDNG